MQDDESQMVDYEFNAVRASLKELKQQGSVNGRSALATTRASLRNFDTIGPLKRRAFADLGQQTTSQKPPIANNNPVNITGIDAVIMITNGGIKKDPNRYAHIADTVTAIMNENGCTDWRQQAVRSTPTSAQ